MKKTVKKNISDPPKPNAKNSEISAQIDELFSTYSPSDLVDTFATYSPADLDDLFPSDFEKDFAEMFPTDGLQAQLNETFSAEWREGLKKSLSELFPTNRQKSFRRAC
jgi:hypothetical protein